MTRRYLVTGGAGFIGRHLCRRLVEGGDAVVVLDDLSTGQVEGLPEGVCFVQADVADARALRTAIEDADGVFHLAAVSSVAASLADPRGTQRVNLGGTHAVLETLGPRPLVYSSTAAIYGDQADQPIREAARPRPISPYASQKLTSERVISGHLHGGDGEGAERAAILRLFNVYGPGQRPDAAYSGVIPRFADQILRGTPVTITGDGRQTRDFICVDDVVDALLAAMRRLCSRTGPTLICANVCSGRSVSIREIAETLVRLAGRPAKLEYVAARTGDIEMSLGDPTRAEDLLGVRAERTLSSGLLRVLDQLGAELAEVSTR